MECYHDLDRPRILQVFIDFGTPLDLHFSTLFDAVDPQRPLRPLPGRVLRSCRFFVCFRTSPGRPPSGFGSVNAISNSISTDSVFGHIWITSGVVFGAFGLHGTTFCDHFTILDCFFRFFWGPNNHQIDLNKKMTLLLLMHFFDTFKNRFFQILVSILEGFWGSLGVPKRHQNDISQK